MNFSSGSKAIMPADSLNAWVFNKKDTYMHRAIVWEAVLPLLGPVTTDTSPLSPPANTFKITYHKNEDKQGYVAFHHHNTPQTEVWSRREAGISQIVLYPHGYEDKTHKRSWPSAPPASHKCHPAKRSDNIQFHTRDRYIDMGNTHTNATT